MRLINTTTLVIQEFFGDYNPKYAILSHTWGAEEVTFQEIQTLSTARLKAGFSKIEGACAQALAGNLEWVWVDTCCIDKTSSAELSEAINSMFAWYRNAVVCYAYLSDVPGRGSLTVGELTVVGGRSEKEAICASKWFTRGWTLQELLAPRNVMFFASDWGLIGNKGSLQSLITQATGIQSEYLDAVDDIANASVARRMSWMAKRVTTREEDSAYCLLGIFEVNMPLMYGEGGRAFVRLQEEILKQSTDQSIFCWAWERGLVESTWASILAPCPAVFANAANFRPAEVALSAAVRPYHINNAGISITLNLLRTTNVYMFWAVLSVVMGEHDRTRPAPIYEPQASIPLWKAQIFHRIPIPAVPLPIYMFMAAYEQSFYIQCKQTQSRTAAWAPIIRELSSEDMRETGDAGFVLTFNNENTRHYFIDLKNSTANRIEMKHHKLLRFSFPTQDQTVDFGATVVELRTADPDHIVRFALAIRTRNSSAGTRSYNYYCVVLPPRRRFRHGSDDGVIEAIKASTMEVEGDVEFGDDGEFTVALGERVNYSSSGRDVRMNARIAYIELGNPSRSQLLKEATLTRIQSTVLRRALGLEEQ